MKFLILFLLFTFTFSLRAQSTCQKYWVSKLSPSDFVAYSYQVVADAWQRSSQIADPRIQNADFIKSLAKTSFLTGVSEQQLVANYFKLADIKSPDGLPDGAQIGRATVEHLLYLSALTNRPIETIFQIFIELFPLMEGKVGSNEAAHTLVSLSLFYQKKASDVMKTLDNVQKALEPFHSKLEEIKNKELEKLDDFSRAFASLSQAFPAQPPVDVIFAVIEVGLASGSISNGIKAYEKILDHATAYNYTAHEQAAMIKAYALKNMPIDQSVKLLAELESGAREAFETGLDATVEKPAVNLILLEGQSPAHILDILQNVHQKGEQYGLEGASLVMNSALYSSATKPASLSAIDIAEKE